MHRTPIGLCAISIGMLGFGSAGELLHFDFDDPAHFAVQTAGLPEGSVVGSVLPSATAGAADFRGGLVKLQEFPGPQGPFTIEARFKLRNYGPESSRFIADVLNTGTWNSNPPATEGVPTQGFSFRVGGSYLYPVLPRDRYATDQEWLSAQEIYSHIDRGRMSKCFADFVIARRDVENWKQALTENCIELGVWTHLAAVWDGENMRVYMNGMDATDSLRLDGVGKPVRIDSLETAFVGARAEGTWDPRDFDGEIDFVRMQDRALSGEEIRSHYKETFQPGKRDSLCQGVAVPEFPEAGKVCNGKIGVKTRIVRHGACTDSTFKPEFQDGDSVEVELSEEPGFDSISGRIRRGTSSFELGPEDLGGLAGYEGAIYWRVRLIPNGKGKALAKTATVTEGEEWSLPRPMVLNMAGTTPILHPAPRLVRAEKGLILPGRIEPMLFDLAGRRVPARFHKVPGSSVGQGLWRLESLPPSACGVLLAR